jgi:RimJ/RimL family protein N-acetyltransferase
MPLVEVADREILAAVLRQNRDAHVYEIGDLDDAEWPHTRWLGWAADDGLEQVALLYLRPQTPVMIAIAEPPAGAMESLLRAALEELPSPLYVHATARLLDVLEARFGVVEAHTHLKLALRLPGEIDRHAVPVDVLGTEDLEDLDELYREAYPGTWFEPHQLDTGRYVGIREDGRLVCVAGLHVYSPAYGVAALGNVATLPAARGRGLAQGACAALCRLLLDDGIATIALNVRADNIAARRAYERIGFETVAEYVEASLAAR